LGRPASAPPPPALAYILKDVPGPSRNWSDGSRTSPPARGLRPTVDDKEKIMNRGLIGTIIGVLVIIILVIVILQLT
jgi:hypothetical protein